MSSKSNESRCIVAATLVGVGMVSVLLFAFAGAGTLLAAEQDSCVACHSNPDFLVTNKKLYDYFHQWTASVHRQEEVACSDCHGGDPRAADKEAAHGEGVGASDEASGIYYQNVPQTCGACHDAILEGFEKSEHGEHVKKQEDELQGPTCVTCHGSMNIGVLDAITIEAACARCHNEKRDSYPEIPEKAGAILNRFVSLDRFYRYVTTRIDPAESTGFFRDVDARYNKLSITWHKFDLEAIDEESMALLGVLKKKRDDIHEKTHKHKKKKKE